MIECDVTDLDNLPADPYWLLRVVVENDGDPVPYHLRLLWHHQFIVRPALQQAPAATISAASHRLK